MCGQGDVEILHDWKSHYSIDDLKRMVEERGYSAFTVSAGLPSFGHAALKSFPFKLTKEHCRPISTCCRHPCTIYIFTPDANAPPKQPKAMETVTAHSIADGRSRVTLECSGVQMYTTSMLGGHTGVSHGRAGSATPKLVEFPSTGELHRMSRAQIDALGFTKVGWLARGGLDALQFTRTDGVTSPFYGASPSLNKSAQHFGDVRGQMRWAEIAGEIRAVDVYWYMHDVTGLAFLDGSGAVLAQEGPGSCREGYGERRIELAPHEKLVGFKLYTDHCTPQIAFHIADLGGAAKPKGEMAVVMGTPLDGPPPSGSTAASWWPWSSGKDGGGGSSGAGGSGSQEADAAMPLFKIVEVLKRELGLEGDVVTVVNDAAAELGIDASGKNLIDLARECHKAIKG